LQECAQHKDSQNLSENTPIHIDNMAHILAQRLKTAYQTEYYFVWDWAHYGWNVWEEGVAVLSKYPILDWESRYVSTGTSKSIGSWETVSRMAIYASVDIPWFGRVNIFSAHLSWRVSDTDQEQNNQIIRLREFVEEKENLFNEPVLSFVCGDFNGDPTSDAPYSEGYETMMTNGTYVDSYHDIYANANFKPAQRKHDTIKGDFPGRIDYVFMKKNQTYSVNASQIIFTSSVIGQVSDHYGVISKIRRNAPPYQASGGTHAKVLFPNGNETLSGIQTLTWTARSDSYTHNFSYSISYSSDNGNTWILIAENLNSTGHNWDTTWIPSSSTYLLKVVARRSDALFTLDVSDAFFELYNHVLSTPTVITPNGGEIVNETVVIEWTEALDSLDHAVEYLIEYSTNNGSDGVFIANSSIHRFDWDTLDLVIGENYSIKVTAICSEGLIKSDESDSLFEIQNHLLSTPIVNYPNGGESLISVNRITWKKVVDTLGHDVLYAVYYSSNSGLDWSVLTENIDTTLYSWDVSNVVNGNNYLIKVIATCSAGLHTEDLSDETFTVSGGMVPTSIQDTTTTTSTSSGWTFLIVFLPILMAIKQKKRKK
ncbi:MAG: endonuclease/exonuclease/phosphatase family protein, partial [Candidatus Kariarchaeaceae archaeon]